jgi:hypothetical protein
MAIYEQISATVPSNLRTRPPSSLIRWPSQRVAVGIRACVDYCAGAAMYDHRRALSDAELHKRGLSRETLALGREATRRS